MKMDIAKIVLLMAVALFFALCALTVSVISLIAFAEGIDVGLFRTVSTVVICVFFGINAIIKAKKIMKEVA